jgi:hypothetical protein
MTKTEQLREWRKKNPDKVAEHQRNQYQKYREKKLAYRREYVRKNKDRIAEINRKSRENMSPEKREAMLARKRITTMMRRYGLTPDDYDRMLQEQAGTCALCSRTPEQERYKRLNIDHCHDTGRVRGLLCTPCNHAIGVLGDTAEHIRRAVAYLER